MPQRSLSPAPRTATQAKAQRAPSGGATSDMVVARIRQMIHRRELRPGTRLPAERALAQKFGVSRGSLRTALSTLLGLGVIDSRHGSGTFVVDGPPRLPSEGLSMLSGLHEVPLQTMYETRLILEPPIAALSATHASPVQIDTLTAAVTAMEAACKERRAEAFWRADVAFHRTLVEAAGNVVLASLCKVLFDVIEEREARHISEHHDLDQALKQHVQILKAVKRRDAAAASRHMTKHLQQAALEFHNLQKARQ